MCKRVENAQVDLLEMLKCSLFSADLTNIMPNWAAHSEAANRSPETLTVDQSISSQCVTVSSGVNGEDGAFVGVNGEDGAFVGE